MVAGTVLVVDVAALLHGPLRVDYWGTNSHGFKYLMLMSHDMHYRGISLNNFAKTYKTKRFYRWNCRRVKF